MHSIPSLIDHNLIAVKWIFQPSTARPSPLCLACWREFVPGGKIVAFEYVALNPTRADRRPGSFKINLRSGRWADFATGDKGGDPVSLVAYVEGVSQGEAARRLARMLGLDTREGRRHG